MKRRTRALLAPASILLALAACGGDDSGDTDASPGDSDGAVADASTFDAGDDGGPGSIDAGADAASPFVCGPVDQTGCGDGEKCDLAKTGTFGCVPDGDIGELGRCDPSRPNACVAGFTCRDTNYGDFRCARLCDPDAPDPCRAGDTCTSMRTTGGGEAYFMCATIHECQPFEQDCADETLTCSFTTVGAFCLTPSDAPLPDGSVCDVPTDCEVGSTCLDLGPSNRCVRLCDPDDGQPGCSGDAACTPLGQVGPQPVGACDLESF